MAGLTVLGSMVAIALAQAPSVSGVYVGASANTVQLVQIVRTPDGHLAGRIEEVSLSEGGALKDETIALEGAADGDQITLSPKSLLLSGNAATLTGFVNGNLLDLSWQGSGHRTLKRADAYAFEAAVTGLKARSSMIRADNDARTRAAEHAEEVGNLLRSAQDLSDEIAGFKREAVAARDRMTVIRSGYAELQVQSSRYRHRERVLNTQSAWGLEAAKQGVNAAGADVEIERLHTDAVATRSHFDGLIAAGRRSVANAELKCRAFTSPNEPSVESACRSVGSSVGELEAVAAQTDRSFAEAEAAYQHPADYTPIGRRLISGFLK